MEQEIYETVLIDGVLHCKKYEPQTENEDPTIEEQNYPE